MSNQYRPYSILHSMPRSPSPHHMAWDKRPTCARWPDTRVTDLDPTSHPRRACPWQSRSRSHSLIHSPCTELTWYQVRTQPSCARTFPTSPVASWPTRYLPSYHLAQFTYVVTHFNKRLKKTVACFPDPAIQYSGILDNWIREGGRAI